MTGERRRTDLDIFPVFVSTAFGDVCVCLCVFV